MAARKRKNQLFFDCVVAGFDEVGTKLKSTSRIVWPSYSEEETRAIAITIERCLTEKGRMCPPLDAALDQLRKDRRTTRVTALVQALADICQ